MTQKLDRELTCCRLRRTYDDYELTHAKAGNVYNVGTPVVGRVHLANIQQDGLGTVTSFLKVRQYTANNAWRI